MSLSPKWDKIEKGGLSSVLPFLLPGQFSQVMKLNSNSVRKQFILMAELINVNLFQNGYFLHFSVPITRNW